MSLKGSLECIFDNVSFFLNQNDLCALCLVNHRFNELATPKLYANIVINKKTRYIARIIGGLRVERHT